VLGPSISATAKLVETDRCSGVGIDFTRLPSLSRILIDADDTAHVLLQSGRRCLTVLVSGTSVLEGPVGTTFLVEGLDGVLQAPRLMRMANVLLRANTSSADREPRQSQEYQRLRNALIALDGYHANASQREIAGVLFGKDLAEAAWRKGDLSFKQRARRAIQLGRRLSAGDYRRLLR